MKIYAVFANDNTNGTTHKLFLKAVEAFKSQGHEVDVLSLYEREAEIPFFKHNRAEMERHPFYLENKERFLNSDLLLLVFPLFWYSVPGIMKAWLDMINTWAYQYESGTYAKPLHHIQQAIVIYCSMQDKEHLDKELHNPVEQQLTETCKFIGIPKVHVCMIDQVTKLQPEDLKKHLEAVSKLCKNCS